MRLHQRSHVPNAESDVIMGYRFLCIELASYSLSIYTLAIITYINNEFRNQRLPIKTRQEDSVSLTSGISALETSFSLDNVYHEFRPATTRIGRTTTSVLLILTIYLQNTT